jgi:hypothetical protein
MKKELKTGMLEYERPNIVTTMCCVEQGFADSSMLEDMKETEGEWAY